MSDIIKFMLITIAHARNQKKALDMQIIKTITFYCYFGFYTLHKMAQKRLKSEKRTMLYLMVWLQVHDTFHCPGMFGYTAGHVLYLFLVS